MPKRKKRLKWSESALAELDAGIAYYTERNPIAAQRMLDEINRAALSLIAATLPAKGKVGRVPGTRDLVLSARTPYILVFREAVTDSSEIQILRTLHTARKYP